MARLTKLSISAGDKPAGIAVVETMRRGRAPPGGGHSNVTPTPRAPADRKRTRLDSSHPQISFVVLFFNDTATTEIYTLSLHDALPIFAECAGIEVVEVLTGGHGTADEAVDLRGGQACRDRGRRDDAAGARLRRVVALERHANHLRTS